MRLWLGLVAAVAGPGIAGWLLVRRIWPEAPRGLRLALGIGLGTGITGTVYFLALVGTNSAELSLSFSEAFLFASILVLARRPTRAGGIDSLQHLQGEGKGGFLFFLLALLGGAALLFLLGRNVYGQWDAIAIWNLKAKFIALSPEKPLIGIIDPALALAHTDYPLVLPSLVARGWQYVGHVSTAVPLAFGALFTVSTVFLLVHSLTILSCQRQAYVAGSVLIGTPFFLDLGTFQYADIVICFFMTAAIAMFCIHDSLQHTDWRLPFFGGLAAGIAASTKNEGILFVIALLATRLLLLFWRRTWRSNSQEVWGTLLGVLPGLVAALSFKALPVIPDHVASSVTLEKLLTRLPIIELHWAVIKGLAWQLSTFGEWLIFPTPLLVAHVFIVRKSIRLGRGRALWLTPALMLTGILTAYYFVYLLSPYELSWLIETSLARLLVQLWPSALVLYAMVVSPRPQFAERDGSLITKMESTRIPRAFTPKAIVGAILLLFFVTVGWTLFLAFQESNTPVITLSKTEVVAGSDSYIFKIKGLAGRHVLVRYAVDNGKTEEFSAELDSKGEIRFDVSADVRKGTYRFLEFRAGYSERWIPAHEAVTVK